MNKHGAHVVLGKNSSNSNNHSNSAKARRQRQQCGAEDPLGDVGVNVGSTNANLMTQAHTVLPRIIKGPSVLESFSRNLRTFIPAFSLSHSPPSPSMSHPPRRPLSFGSVSPADVPTAQLQHQAPSQGDQDEPITWAGWDTLGGLRVLLLVYPTGLQVWDTTNLAAVKELVNLRVESVGMRMGSVKRIVLFPELSKGEEAQDELHGSRPVMGILSSEQLTVYSLVSHTVVTQIPFKQANHIVARPSFTVVSTTNPPTLHILSTRTFRTLHTVLPPSSSATPPIFALSQRLLAYASPGPPSDLSLPPGATFIASDEYTRAAGVGVSSAGIASSVVKLGGGVWSGVKGVVDAALAGAVGGDTRQQLDAVDSPHAQAQSAGLGAAYGYGFSRSAPTPSGGAQAYGRAQTESNSSEKAGNGSSSGSKSAGWVTVLDLDPASSPRHITSFVPFPSSTTTSTFTLPFSSPSSPSNPPAHYIAYLSFPAVGSGSGGPLLYVSPQHGHHLSVFQIRPGVPLRPLHSPSAVSPGSPCPANTKPWHLYDLHRGVTSARIEGVATGEERSGRWVGVTTARRTLHIFATNPYGGKPTRGHFNSRIRNATRLQPLSTTLHPLVRIHPTLNSSSTSTNSGLPLAPPSPSPSTTPFFNETPSSSSGLSAQAAVGGASFVASPPPILLTFLPASATYALPAPLLPHPSTPRRSPSSFSSSYGLSYSSTNDRAPVQDLLVFDPLSGELTLHRLWLDWVVGASSSVGGNDVGDFGRDRGRGRGRYGYSVSLPVPIKGIAGIGEEWKAGKANGNGKGASADRDGEDEDERGELVGREAVVAVWGLRRGRDWGEVRWWDGKKEGKSVIGAVKGSVMDYLSQAELTTHSRLPTILPRSIYLSHQFSFYTFAVDGGDYHSLLLRAHLDIPSTKLDVRKDVVAINAIAPTPTSSSRNSFNKASPFPQGDPSSPDAFIHGAIDLQGEPSAPSSPQTHAPFTHTRHRSSLPSFDTPLTSAIHTTLDYSGQSPPVLPMFPNGATSSPSASGVGVLTSLPGRTKHVAQGVNEGLRVIKREIIERRRRSMKGVQRSGAGSVEVGLQFDADGDTVFLVDPEEGESEGDGFSVEARDRDDSGGSGASMSISTPGSGFAGDLPPTTATSPGNNTNAGAEDSLWDAWDDEARATIAEVEMFDEISVAGFLDEEQAEERKRVGRGGPMQTRTPQRLMEAQLAPELEPEHERKPELNVCGGYGGEDGGG